MTMNQYVTQHLLLLSISTISYLRYLFPSKCFDNIYFNGMALKRLNGNSLESRRLLEHIEQGLFDALDKDFVKSIIFYLYHDNEVIEVYTMNIINSNTVDEGVHNHKEEIKNGFTDLIKSLIVFLQKARREWCLKHGKINEYKSANYCSIKAIHSNDSIPTYIPPTFDPPTRLEHFTSNKYKANDEIFEVVYESLPFNTGCSILKLKCERRLLE